jgi:HEAT repeat protein
MECKKQREIRIKENRHMFGNKLGSVEKAIRKNNVGTLVALGEDKDRAVSLAAIAGLGNVGGQEACNYLVSHLGCQEPELRMAIAQALGAIGDKHTKAFLSSQMNKETDPKVKEVMRSAMLLIKEY